MVAEKLRRTRTCSPWRVLETSSSRKTAGHSKRVYRWCCIGSSSSPHLSFQDFAWNAGAGSDGSLSVGSSRASLGPSACSIPRTSFSFDKQRPQRPRGALSRGHFDARQRATSRCKSRSGSFRRSNRGLDPTVFGSIRSNSRVLPKG